MSHKTKLTIWPIFLVFILGMILTIALIFSSWMIVTKESNDEFHIQARALNAIVIQRMESALENVRSIGVLFDSSIQVDESQFSLFTGEKISRYNYLKSIMYLPLVRQKQRASFERSMVENGYPGFRIKSRIEKSSFVLARQDAFLPIRYIEPRTPKSVRLLGHDYLSVAGFGDVIKKALDSGREQIFFEKDARTASSDILLIRAVYAGKSMPVSVQERKAFFNGVVVLRINVNELLLDLMHHGGFHAEIVSNRFGEKIVVRNETGFTHLDSKTIYWQNAEFPLVATGGLLQLNVRKPVYLASSEIIVSAISGFIGLVISILLTVVARIATLRAHELKIRNMNIEEEVIKKTEELASEKIALESEIAHRLKTESMMVKLSSALENSGDSIFITDMFGVIEYVNLEFEQISGYTRDELIGKKASIVKSGKHERQFYENLWEVIRAGETFRGTFINKNKSGVIYYEEKTITSVKDKYGEIVNYVSTGKDISRQVVAQEQLAFLAHHDSLTKLPNRSAFAGEVDLEINKVKSKDESFAIMFIDLDRFKYVNDTLGHDAGDSLLLEIAKRLQCCVRETDTVARLGGDEFTVLIRCIQLPVHAAIVAKNILEEFARKLLISDQNIYVTASIGIAIYPNDGRDKESLMKNADIAMYHAKDNGRNEYQFFTPELAMKDAERLNLESELRSAVENHEFFLEYQPRINMATSELVGMEALLRWRHPRKGIIYPDKIINVLDETGLMLSVGEWIVKSACEQTQKWQLQGFKPFRMSINLSNKQLRNTDFIRRLELQIEETGLLSKWIEIELTENSIMRDTSELKENLQVLNKSGINIAIDDFGTGYFSLDRLKSLPVNSLKIDKSFIHEFLNCPENEAIVKSIIGIAKSLSLDVVAEGIETEHQFERLKDFGCDQAQGYFISRPLTKNEASNYLANKHSMSEDTQQRCDVVKFNVNKYPKKRSSE